MAALYDIVIAAGVEAMSRVPIDSMWMGAGPFGPRVAARYGLQTMCEAGGVANATIIERLRAPRRVRERP